MAAALVGLAVVFAAAVGLWMGGAIPGLVPIGVGVAIALLILWWLFRPEPRPNRRLLDEDGDW